VVVKGGHAQDDPVVDLLVEGNAVYEFRAPRIRTTSTHGTGCTFSAAITAGLAQGLELRAAVAQAKTYVSLALERAEPLGHGHGPLGHIAAEEPAHAIR
jgi:hydroxymethylpyrimidine/phosphomethylpyrimidine kinase